MKMDGRREMQAKPLLLMDIDGVISLWGFEMDMRPPGAFAVIDGIPHFLSTRAAEHLLTLQDAFDLVWCSGWEEKADEYLPHLLGLPRGLPHLSFERSRADVSARAHWKLAAIDAFAGLDRPLAWVDDAFNDACHAWALERGAPTLLVQTEPRDGLREDHAAALAAWAAAL
jgi:Swiss Army Knife RNA repair-like protein